jgi:hypothetical protein
VYAKAADPSVLPRVEFKSGGNVDPKFATTNPASYLVSTGLVRLGTDWQEYCLELSGKNLKNVVSPFTVVISSAYNPAVKVALKIDGVSFSTQPCGKKKSESD